MPDRSTAPSFVKSTSFDLIRPDVHTLPNGLQVFYISGGSQDVLKIEFVYEAGRWFEKETAAAYFTSNLLSKGTKTKSSFDIARIFDQYGAHLEISPGLDFVSISLYALRKNLQPVLRLLMEILDEPAFSKKEFSQTKTVFIQNLQVNNEKTSFVASQLFRKNLFGAHHPYGSIVEENDVEALEVRDFTEHYATNFRAPKVFVSGTITAGDKELMSKHFAQHNSVARTLPPQHKMNEGPKSERVEKKESVQSSIRMGKRSVQRSHEHYVSILFVSHILGGYFGSRLMKNIREDKGLTYGISASLHGMLHSSYLVVGADVNKENTDLTFEEVRKELKILRTALISDDELETTRNHFIGSLQSEITTSFAHAEKIKTINLYNLREDHYQNMIRKIDSITPQEIADISERYYHEDTFVHVAVG